MSPLCTTARIGRSTASMIGGTIDRLREPEPLDVSWGAIRSNGCGRLAPAGFVPRPVVEDILGKGNAAASCWVTIHTRQRSSPHSFGCVTTPGFMQAIVGEVSVYDGQRQVDGTSFPAVCTRSIRPQPPQREADGRERWLRNGRVIFENGKQ